MNMNNFFVLFLIHYLLNIIRSFEIIENIIIIEYYFEKSKKFDLNR